MVQMEKSKLFLGIINLFYKVKIVEDWLEYFELICLVRYFTSTNWIIAVRNGSLFL